MSKSCTNHVVANQSYVELLGQPCIHSQETGSQSGVRSFIMPTHLVQELNVSTVIYWNFAESDWDSNADFYRELGSKDKEIKAGPESNEDDLLNERKDIETMIYRWVIPQCIRESLLATALAKKFHTIIQLITNMEHVP